MPLLKPWRTFLNRRATLAVIIVAIIVTLSYWSLATEIREEYEDLRIVSIAKQQATETVTTLYLAHLTAYAPDPTRREVFSAGLSQAVLRLEKRHKVLSLEARPQSVPDEIEEILRTAYFGDHHIDREMEAFLREARDVLESGGDVAELNELARIHTTLLPALTRLHELLRGAADAAFTRIQRLAALQWLVAIFTLGIVLALILRPSSRRTEQIMREMWQAKAKAREKAAAANAARNAQARFIRTMNHELRTPLNAILGMAQLLQMRKLPPREAGYIRDIQQAGEHLLGLINNVLDLGRIEAKQVTISRSPTMVGDLLETTTGMLRPLAAQKSLALSCRCAEELSEAYLADAGHIQQVLVNLIGNAVKFTNEGWIEVRAVPAGRNEGGLAQVRFEVEDTGVGVPPEREDAIFEEFQQADENPEGTGTGLGLAISRKLVQLMGGQMGLESNRKTGSLFWFVLPLERAVAAI